MKKVIETTEENPRESLEKAIREGDLETLLRKAGELHGHFCSYLAYGVKAGYLAVKELGIKNMGMEEVVAIVETNNCFSDGIQMVTGCTFGNNSLIFKDVGKTAVTVAKRDGSAVRIVLDPAYEKAVKDEYREANELWEKIVIKRDKATREEQDRMMKLFADMAFKELKKPAERMFRITKMRIETPDYAPIFQSAICSICGESTYKPLIRDGKPICLECAGNAYFLLDGAGIHRSKKEDKTVGRTVNR